MAASPAGGNGPCNYGAVLQKCKDGLQPAVEGVAPEDRSPFALEEGELAHRHAFSSMNAFIRVANSARRS